MANTNKKITIWYWIVTGLFGAFMAWSGVPDIMKDPQAVKLIADDMHYPMYFLPYIGVAKIQGGIAILVPGFPRIKEWAYAGLMFDLISATYSFIALGKPMSDWAFMLIFIAIGFASYFLYHKNIAQQQFNYGKEQ